MLRIETPPILILADNGSTKASATLQLRKISDQLSDRIKQKIYPVSLQHADIIPAEKLDGIKALVLRKFLREQLKKKQKNFIILPLFFGNSRALTKFIPDVQSELEDDFGKFNIKVLNTLYAPPASGNATHSQLSKIIYQHILQTAKINTIPLDNIVLVDHGSPSPMITAVRKGVAKELSSLLNMAISQAVMERRKGQQYDFNGQLLEDWLIQAAEKGLAVIIALLFSLPGRHAGEGGDIEVICKHVVNQYPGFKVAITPLVGEHPLVLDILESRIAD